MRQIFTIGYERAELADFLATLKSMKVGVVLDIREVAISRRKGFSKSALEEALKRAGIEYVHEKRLGSPKAIRDRLHQDGNYRSFFRDFDAYLKTQRDLLRNLADTLKGSVVLLCYERDPHTCHRLSVAKMLAQMTGIEPRHLGVTTHEQRKAGKTAYSDIGQSLSAA